MNNRLLLLAWWGLMVLLGWGGLGLALAQADEPPITMPDELLPADAAAGLTLYQRRCASCHGNTGLGDGEMAAMSISPPTAIGSPAYLATANLEAMRQMILTGDVQRGMPPFGPGTSSPLSQTDVDNVLAALYTLSVGEELWPEVMVRGRVVNVTHSQRITDPLTIQLHGFTTTFERAVAITTTLDSQGIFTFTLNNVAPSWAFLTYATYEGIDFSGNVFQFNNGQTSQEIAIRVYDLTRADELITLSQWHIWVETVANGQIRISELFMFVNQGDTVYVGPVGDPLAGTLRIPLPPEARNPIFQRGFANGDSFLPANDFMAIGSDWVDSFPLYPDDSGMILLTQYSLPYDGQLLLERPVYYAVDAFSLMVPQGMQVAPVDGWQEGIDTLMSGGESFVTYRNNAATRGSTVMITLSGQPVPLMAGMGSLDAAALGRNETTELIIGFVALAAVLGGGFYLYQQRRTPFATPSDEPPSQQKERLVQAIASLDDAYADGTISEAAYLAERQRLKIALLDSWEAPPEA